MVAGIALALLAVGWTVYDRLELVDRPVWVPVLLAGLVALLVARPFAASLLVFLALPFFGNHPGGPYMEVLNLPLATSALGLAVHAWRGRRPPPGGRIFRWAGLVLLTAVVALVPALPGVVLRAAQVNELPLTLVQSLTCAEWDPLYPAGAFLQLLLATAWAYVLAWAGADADFTRRALRAVAFGVVLVALLGALDFHGVLDVHESYLVRIDPNVAYVSRLRSIFFNPSWLGMYFTFAFGLSLGLLWLERPPWRCTFGLAFLASYGYFHLNPQRAGLLAVHAALAVAAAHGFVYAPRRRRGALLLAASAVVVAAVLAFWLTGTPAGTGLDRALGESGLDENRRKLWLAALAIWRSAPVFGIGEAAFAARFREFVPAGSALDQPFYGDAHSTWLQILATRGLVGLLAWLGLLAALIAAVRRAFRAEGTRRGVAAGLACGLAAFLTYSFFQGMFYLQSVQVLFWGAVALLAALSPEECLPARLSGRTRWAIAGLAAAALLQLRWSRTLYQEMDVDLARQPRGFYPLERRSGVAVRWSARKGTLCLYPSGPTLNLRVIPGSRSPQRLPVTVALRVGERLADRFEIPTRAAVDRSIHLPEAAGFRPPALPIPFGECRPDRPAVPLTVEVSSVWNPSSSGLQEWRHRGVALREPTYGPP